MNPELLNNPHQLDYTIHSCSYCSPTYHPFTILENSPTEPSSRWSGSGPPQPTSRPIDNQKITTTNTNNNNNNNNNLKNQLPGISPDSLFDSNINSISSNPSPKKKDYIIIDLGKPCIVRSIIFGKFHRPHPCNVKLFRIWGGLAPGEGQGDFRALLGSHSFENNNLHLSNQSASFFKYPSQSNLQQDDLSKNYQSNSNLNNNFDLYNNNNNNSSKIILKPQFQTASTHPIKARGERHRAGPRMELLAQGELKNDTIPETVPLRWKNNRVPWFKSSFNHPINLSSTSQLGTHHPDSLLSNQTVIVPIRYIKIEPLSAAGTNYNCSIWHIAVKGHDEDHILRPCLENYERWKASAALRLCLKHLRQTGHFEAFQALLKSAANPSLSSLVSPPSYYQFDRNFKSVDLPDQAEGTSNTVENPEFSNSAQFYFEHYLVSALHSALVSKSQALTEFESTSKHSNYPIHRLSPISRAEQIVIQAASEGLFDQWARDETPTLTCNQIRQASSIPSEIPCPRGGHQMCIDSKRRKIWLFGGFDGYKDLGDLWVYHLEPCETSSHEDETSSSCYPTRNDLKSTETVNLKSTETTFINSDVKYNRWQRISQDVKQENGPAKRSCHKMVLDEMTGDLYVMGRYMERGPTDINQSNDSAEGGNFFFNTDRLNVQTVRISHNLRESDNNSQVEHAEVAPELHDNIIPDATNPSTPRHETDVDELMGNGETLFQPPPISTPTRHFKNDFFRFRPFEHPSSDKFLETNGRIGIWERLSQDTYSENGPKLIFDHQMVLDSERRKIYLFGGKIIQPIFTPSQDPSSSSSRPNVNQYSGLFEYDITKRTWVQLMADPGSAENNLTNTTSRDLIPSRMGHSLIFDKKRSCLWILTGERDHHYYSDIWRYDIEEQRAELIIGDYTHGGRHRQGSEFEGNQYGSAPEAGFSQRITFDPDTDEWHMFCGLCRDRGALASEVPLSHSSSTLKSQLPSSEFWSWRINPAKWTQVSIKNQFDRIHSPPPRFAHQMVFDTLTKTHYVFGGNPADNDNEPIRLGDFWKLKLIRPSRQEALRRCLFALRRQHFIELCQDGTDTAGALWYLQNDLSSVTNHLDEREGRLFRACTSYLLAGPGPRMVLLEEASTDEGDHDQEGDCLMHQEDHHSSSPHFLPASSSSLKKDHDDSLKHFVDLRISLFQDLLKFFPDSMAEPTESLIDLIDAWGDRETFW